MEYSDDKILEDFAEKNIDVVVGGPPCQGFSSANRWNKENEDPRNKLFFEYLRFVELLKPEINLRGNMVLACINDYYDKQKYLHMS